MADHSKHFDAARPARLDTLFALIRARWGVLVAFSVAVAIVGLLMAGIFIADRSARALVASAAGSTTIFLQLDARASAVDADALGPRIKALPAVADATLRTRDESLKQLVADGLPPPDGRNPLPDVWTVRLRPPPAAGVPSWSNAVAETRKTLGALPQIEATRVDERWVGTVDRLVAQAGVWRDTGRPVAYSLIAVLLACLGIVAGRALATGYAPPRVSVLALLATISVVCGLIVDAVGFALATSLLPAGSRLSETPTWVPGADALPAVALLALACWAIAILAVVVGGRSGDRENALPVVTTAQRNY